LEESVAEPILAPAVLTASDFSRPTVRGKFIFVGEQKLFVKGVTYGAFEPDEAKREYWDLAQIERDFAAMSANGLNAVRIPHTMPPRKLLDIAHQHGLRVLVGLSAEQYIGYLIEPRRDRPDVGRMIRERVRAVAGHPALLGYALGNEVSAHHARWIGRRKIERYLERLYQIVKQEDPAGLVTYVNYPTTEYLDLPFLDFVCFNVYLESQSALNAYLPRLQNIAGDRPLLMSEVGIDSIRHGEARQAEVLDWQIRTSFALGCAGAFVFSWTDEWFRGGDYVHDWAFGLTDAARKPKPALAVVREAFAAVPLPSALKWLRVSVVVCSYNGSRTLADCLDGLRRLQYPNYEVIVVNDGSTDRTGEIAAQSGFRVITTENRGLSHARNVGMQNATGEIVAYTDDDARPDSHWLMYLTAAFLRSDHAAIGGPNIAPGGDGEIADCVANAPGGPTHVLLSDTEAEHIPGCNMAFRRSVLETIGGFDEQFRVAGDDVDVCWRILERGHTIGFCASAVVWHHRRNSIRTFWRQQKGYGRAEALLEQKWPEKYNAVGHVSWAGRVYGPGALQLLCRAPRIYHGVWGAAPFQTAHQQQPMLFAALSAIPEWWLIVLLLTVVSSLAFSWQPLLLFVPLLGLALALPVIQAWLGAAKARFTTTPRGSLREGGLRAITLWLHIMQPIARLYGRVQHGLTLWRWRGPRCWDWPLPRQTAVFTRTWIEHQRRLELLEESCAALNTTTRRGGAFDAWDLEVRGGMFGSMRMLMAIEDQGSGTQYVRVQCQPIFSVGGVALFILFSGLALLALQDGAGGAAIVLGCLAGAIGVRMIVDGGRSTAVARLAVEKSGNCSA
jgi:GT2 family glycosyltransferase